MRRVLFIALLAVWPTWVGAQTANVQAQAQSALRNGVPQTAIAPLKEALRKGQGDRAALSLLLARLQLAAGNPGDALETLDAASVTGSEEGKVVRGAALAAQGGTTAATAILAPIAPKNAEAALLLARLRAEQGDRDGALELLATAPRAAEAEPQVTRLLLDLHLSSGNATEAAKLLQDTPRGELLPLPELQTARGRLLLLQNNPSEAASAFAAALASADIAPPVRDNARLGLARAAKALGDEGKARSLLREALGAGMTPGALRQTMEEWIRMEKAAGADPSGDLRSWSGEKGTNRSAEAALQLAQIDLEAKGTEAASKSLRELLAREDLEPEQRRRAELLAVEAKIAAGQYPEALAALEATAAENDYRVEMLRGRALAASGAHRNAEATFAAAAESAETSVQKGAAAANRFIAALATGDQPLIRAAWDNLRQTAPAHPRFMEWSLLFAASEARDGKIEGLAALSRRSPASDYSFQAKLALAEWRLARGEAEAAQRILKTAAPEADSAPRAAALAAAEIFTADNEGSKPRAELVTACEAFLATHPDAPEAADVTFKLAELHARGGDHAAAETILAGLAEKSTDAEAGSLAKFLAAQAAARSMSEQGADRALVWFNEVAQGKSDLRHRARFEQASLLLRRKNFADALALHDAVLADNPPADVRNAARMERADILFAMGANEEKKLEEAATAYELISSDETAPPDWRDQAACKRAAALARRGQTEKALALYREILDRPPVPGADQFWFLKAGIEAARLLEEGQDWEAAVAVYDRLASASGTQREELEQRARRLRLEHFIWEN